MSQPSSITLRITRVIDRFTTWTGYLFALLLVPLVLSNTIEVFSRYVLGSPTAWALDTTVISNGSLFMLGAAYALLKGAHVRTDMFLRALFQPQEGHHRLRRVCRFLFAVDGDPVLSLVRRFHLCVVHRRAL
jgi:TRAP-type mannitol/chloroaromatic compound transport system permease small subunit